MRLLTLNSYHFQAPDLGKARAAEVVVASDLFYINCCPGLLEAGGVIIDSQNWCLQGCPFWGELPGQSNLNNCGVDRFMCGHPGPLAFIHHSVTTWVMAH